jgi:aminoglycoside 6-adenylyltransferase
MRSESEMLHLIIETAREDDRIRAVIMNGSRANPHAPRDPFQDYDIVYLVKDVAPFWKNLEWIQRFGELMLLQMPEDMHDPPPANDGRFIYLMLFMDGNRVDLTLYPFSSLEALGRDSQSIVLLDKDSLIGPLPPPSDADYLPNPPTEKQFQDGCNEFWWVSTNIVKGLWRNEVTYAQHEFEFVRKQLLKMVCWYAGVKTDFQVCPGKQGKYLNHILESELWNLYLQSYSPAESEQMWEALEAASILFRTAGGFVANAFGFAYPVQDDEKVMAHMQYVRALPRDTVELYPERRG